VRARERDGGGKRRKEQYNVMVVIKERENKSK
jgi:hypothetical protein